MCKAEIFKSMPLNLGSGWPTSYDMGFLGDFFVHWIQLRWKVIFCFIYIGGIDDHHCWNFLFIALFLRFYYLTNVSIFVERNRFVNKVRVGFKMFNFSTYFLKNYSTNWTCVKFHYYYYWYYYYTIICIPPYLKAYANAIYID